MAASCDGVPDQLDSFRLVFDELSATLLRDEGWGPLADVADLKQILYVQILLTHVMARAANIITLARVGCGKTVSPCACWPLRPKALSAMMNRAWEDQGGWQLI